MNLQQQQSAARSAVIGVLMAIAGYFVARGYLTSDQASTIANLIAPAILTGISSAAWWWGVKSHSASAVVAAVNSDSVPGVKVVRETSPSPQVVIDPKSGDIRLAPTVTPTSTI